MSFEYREQPWRRIRIFSKFTLFLLKLPFYAFLYVIPAARPRRNWSIRRSLHVLAARNFIDTLYDIDPAMTNRTPIEPTTEEEVAREESYGFVWVEPAPNKLISEDIREVAKLNKVTPAKISGYWYGRRDPFGKAGKKASANERVIYHFHGGGFVSGTGHPSNKAMKTLLGGLIEYIPGIPRAFALEYRLSSTSPFPQANPFPAALLDAIAGYRYLIQDLGFHPSNVIVSGDSAGGLIALWLVQYLSAQHYSIKLSPPGGLLLLSPTVDWTNTRMERGSSMVSNKKSDFIDPILTSRYTLRALLGNIPESKASQHFWICPGSAELIHTPGIYPELPATCIVAGGAEQTLDSIVLLKNRLTFDMKTKPYAKAVTYLEKPDATHDFLVTAWHEPERTETLKELKKWAEEHIWHPNNDNHIV